LWQRVFCRCVLFLLHMLTQYFLSVKETFIVHLLSLFSHPVNKGVHYFSWHIFVFAFSFPLLSVPYFQFFQNLKRKIQENELEQTILQEKTKVSCSHICMSYFCDICRIKFWNLIYTLRRAKRLKSKYLGRAWHLRRHLCQAFTRSNLLKLSWKKY
jgi:hypothetical protein